MRFNVLLITALAAFGFAAPTPSPDGASSEDVGCAALYSEGDALYVRCVGIETAAWDFVARA